MSVEDNVRIGLHNQVQYGMFSGIFRMPRYWQQEKRDMHERALELLAHFRHAGSGERNRRAVCPTARSAGWKSSARWRPTRRCCCWTSRRRA